MLKERNKEARGEGRGSLSAQDRATTPPLREWDDPDEITFEAKNLAITQARERQTVRRDGQVRVRVRVRLRLRLRLTLTLTLALALTLTLTVMARCCRACSARTVSCCP